MKRYLLVKDEKRRKLFLRTERKKLMLKYIVSNVNYPESVRVRSFQKLSCFPKNSSKVRIKNRCMFTGRGPFTLRAFKSSRIIFRENASFGRIVGVKKASW
jgi:small subunit ribosomal protein S14